MLKLLIKTGSVFVRPFDYFVVPLDYLLEFLVSWVNSIISVTTRLESAVLGYLFFSELRLLIFCVSNQQLQLSPLKLLLLDLLLSHSPLLFLLLHFFFELLLFLSLFVSFFLLPLLKFTLLLFLFLFFFLV